MSLFSLELLLVKIFAIAAEMKGGHSVIRPSNHQRYGGFSPPVEPEKEGASVVPNQIGL